MARDCSLEADIIGASSMRIFKIVCVIFCAWSVATFLRSVRDIHAAPVGTSITRNAVIGIILSVVGAVLWASALYGVHRRSLMAWKLGWVIIAVFFLEFIVLGLSSTMRLPKTDSPWIASAALVVVAIVVAFSWGRWWNRQRNYFETPKA